MPKYVIEREVPGAGSLSVGEIRDLSAKSNKVICDLGPEIRWLQSFVTEDKLYCIYVAPDKDIIYEHARCGGFPADDVSEVAMVIDPSSGE
jgi:Nickel responsive protein SCO4226-like